MPTWDVDAGPPPAQDFHPEIGYLCPTDQMRRKMRSAAMAILAGMVIATSIAVVLAPHLVPQLAPHSPGNGAGEEAVLSAMALPSSDKATRPAGESVPAPLALAAAVTEEAAPPRAASCDDLLGSFLSPQCRVGKTGKSRMTRKTRAARAAHAASDRVATAPIGHSDDAGSKRAAASGAASAADTAAAAVATNEAPTVVAPEKPAAPVKRPVKTAHKQAPSRNFDAPAAAPFGFFHEPSRAGNGAWAMWR